MLWIMNIMAAYCLVCLGAISLIDVIIGRFDTVLDGAIGLAISITGLLTGIIFTYLLLDLELVGK